MAPLPKWLQTKKAKKAHRTGPVEGELIREGERNEVLMSLGGKMRHQGMIGAAILAALTEENRLRCRPPLDEEEVLA